MPTITVEGPKIDNLDRKRKFVGGVARLASEFYELPLDIIVVLLKENAPENVGVGGELIFDRLKRESQD